MSLKQIAVAALGMTMLGSSAQAAPIIVGTYYEDNVTASCSAAPCTAFFSAVPAGKAVLVTNIACWILVNNSTLLSAELTVGAGHTVRRETLQVGPVMPQGANNSYTAGGEVKFLFGQGKAPRVSAYYAGTGSTLVCRIVGTR